MKFPSIPVHKFATAGILIGVIAVSSVRGAAIAYDGFSTPGLLSGQNGGTGWSTAWSVEAPDTPTVVAGGLNYSGGAISINGGSNSLRITQGGTPEVWRDFSTINSTGATVLWFSYLFQATNGEENDYFNAYLGDDNQEAGSVGIGDSTITGGRNFSARISATSSGTLSSYVDGTTYLLVGRASTEGSTGAAGIFDQVELWVNPTSLTLGTANSVIDLSSGINNSSTLFDTFAIRTTGLATDDQIALDELRIGTTLVDVVPEPSSVTLLIGALGGWVISRRRCQRTMSRR